MTFGTKSLSDAKEKPIDKQTQQLWTTAASIAQHVTVTCFTVRIPPDVSRSSAEPPQSFLETCKRFGLNFRLIGFEFRMPCFSN